MSLLKSCITDILYKSIGSAAHPDMKNSNASVEITIVIDRFNEAIEEIEKFIKKHYREKI